MHQNSPSFWQNILDRSAGKPWQDKAVQLELPFNPSPTVQAPWSRETNQVSTKENQT